MAWQTAYPNWEIGSTSLKSAGLVASTTNGTATAAGRGTYLMKIVISAIEIASGDELYGLGVQGNTLAATTTWNEIDYWSFGAAAVSPDGLAGAAGTYWFVFHNEGDNQVRVRTVVAGTVATGINYTADIYPLATRNS